MKVRIALQYKGIPFTKVPVNPQDRSEVVKVSGQPLTPVLVHGATVVYDSAAILRYLDANFRSTPALFSADYEEMKKIEEWETWGRTAVPEPVGTIFNQFFSPEKDAAKIAEASRKLHDLTAKTEEKLSKDSWLVGDRMTAADVTAAPFIYYGMARPVEGPFKELSEFFVKSLKLGEGRDRTRAWVQKVMAYDR